MKVWQIAFEMFGSNGKNECKIVKNLMKGHSIESLCEDYSIIKLADTQDIGWIIHNDLIKELK